MAELDSQIAADILIALVFDELRFQLHQLHRVFLCMALVALAPIIVLAQSGRQQQNGQSKENSTNSQPQRPRRSEINVPDTEPLALPSSTQNVVPPMSGAEDADVIRINSNLVVVPASVVDTQGRVVTDLNLSDFQLLVDGQPKSLSELSRSETPVRLALLFDNSGSLIEARALQIQAAVSFFRRVLRPIDQTAIFSVSTRPALEQSLTSDIEKLVRTIESFGRPEGGTALFDAVAQAATYLKPNAGRKVIVIVSDGVDTTSELDFDTTLSRVQAGDCQIYVVQTGLSENANLRQLAAERRMQEFSAQTGGSVYAAKRRDDLDAAFSQIAADLAQQYVLSYYPVDERRDGHFCAIRLLVKTRPRLRVRARRGYFAPKA